MKYSRLQLLLLFKPRNCVWALSTHESHFRTHTVNEVVTHPTQLHFSVSNANNNCSLMVCNYVNQPYIEFQHMRTRIPVGQKSFRKLEEIWVSGKDFCIVLANTAIQQVFMDWLTWNQVKLLSKSCYGPWSSLHVSH